MMVEVQLCFGIGPASHGSCDPNATRRAGMISQGSESKLNGGTTSQKVPGYVVEHLAADSALMPTPSLEATASATRRRTVSLAAISFGRFPSEPTCRGSETSLVTPVYRKAASSCPTCEADFSFSGDGDAASTANCRCRHPLFSCETWWLSCVNWPTWCVLQKNGGSTCGVDRLQRRARPRGYLQRCGDHQAPG